MRMSTPDPFTHGVGSFDPTDSSVLLWTRAPGARRIRWHVAPATDVAPAATGDVDVPESADGCVTVEVADLVPGTAYRYWFELDGRRSPVGRTRTLPASGRDPFRIGVVCCADVSRGHFAVYRAVAEADVHLVLHVGDYIYETARSGDVRRAEPDRTLATLGDYRARYAQARADPDLQALHQRHAMVAIWDDHDIADNAWRHGAKGHDADEHGPWEDRLAAAARAWHEWLPARLRDPGEPLAIWRSLTVGDLAELVLLDTRIAGRDEHADGDGSPAIGEPNRSLLGDAQRAWMHERVRDTTRPWCLLVSSVVLNRMRLPMPGGDLLDDAAPSGYAIIDGEALCTDEWDGYPAERDKLVAALADRGQGAVVVSGDVHSSWAFEGPCTRDRRPVAVELVAPCVSSTTMAGYLPPGWRALADELAERLPEARWFELEHHGFVVLDIGPDCVRASWHTVDPEDPEARAEPAAAWVHRLDRPGRLDPAEPEGSDATAASSRHDRPAEVVGTPPRRRLGRWIAAASLALVGAAGAWLLRSRRTS
jgi:alkaline phosphatase D